MLGILRALRRRRLRRRPLPPEWLPVLERRVPFFARLAGAERDRFLELLKLFVWEKHFIGASGLEVSDEIRVTIGACAVRLILHRDLDHYDRLTEIVVYPHDYRHPERDGVILGEAHDWGTVVLSWPAVQQGLANERDGLDTATHEFAHVLDRADGGFDGTPVLPSLLHYGAWARALSHHFLALRGRGRAQRRVLREYGATNEAEFFAVATEAFFEKPRQMRAETPELYAELARFFGSDPAGEERPAAAPGPRGRKFGLPAAPSAARGPNLRNRRRRRR
jgi:Mlc titration factor MtfA (ptsG expression regulator)